MSEPKTSDSAAMAEWLAEAAARWPLVAMGEPAFRAHLARIARPSPVYPVDTYLAAACTLGDAAALRALDEELVARVPAAVRRVDASPAFATEICQQVRVRLLVGEGGGAPRIVTYTGEVPLSAWLRVVALRLAFNAKRRVHGRDATESAELPGEVIDDPEAFYLRTQYRATFARAFERALAALPKDDRTILKLHYVDSLNIDGIGRIYQVHRATIARWLVRIRADVLSGARALLAAEIGATDEEAESVVNALAGELELTLSRVLRND